MARSGARSERGGIFALGPGEQRAIDFTIRTMQGLRLAYVETDVRLLKRRKVGGAPVELDRVFYVVR